MRRWVEGLCSEECAGREPGTREGAAARAVIVDALRAMGHSPEELPVPASAGVNVLARIGGDDARDHAGTVATLLALAQDLRPFAPRAATMTAQLETIQRHMDPQGRCSLPDWSAVLQIIALLEQGLA